MSISPHLKRTAEALNKRDMRRFMGNMIIAQGRFGGPGRCQGRKARKGTTIYWLGVLKYRTK